MRTTLSPAELEGEARLLYAEIVGSEETWAFGWHPIPDPLKPCTRCGAFMGRAGIFVDSSGYAPEDDTFCGECIETYLSGVGIDGNDIRQVLADLCLAQFEDENAADLAEGERLLLPGGMNGH